MFSTRLALVAIGLLRLASPVHSLSLHEKRSTNDAELIARAFEINADAIFPHPPQVDKRGNLLGDLIGGVTTILNAAGDTVNTVVNDLVGGGATSAVASVVAPVTSAAAANNGGGNSPAPAATTTAANGSGNTGNTNANNNNAGSGTTSANNNGSNNNGNSNGNGANTSNGGGAASASGSGNSGNGVTAPMNALYTGSGIVGVLTDHSGHTITTTGTAPVTLTYVTTLPNGVVSTVTEVITPTAEVLGEPANSPSAASRVAAIAGSIVALFIVIFIVAFVLLMLRKRRRAIQLANSRPSSSLSFGSEDILNHRNSTEPLEPTGSMTSFRTAPAYVDGQKMDFPLPPTPSADLTHSEMTGTPNRPISMGSDLTFDLAERRSRTSIIAERNLYRKIGQYPDAGTYTPFALAPSSELGHSEEAFGAVDVNGERNTKDFHENYRRSRNLDFSPSVHENPFNNPAYVAQPVPAATPSTSGGTNQSSLWRKATFGSSQQPNKHRDSHPPSSFAQPHIDTFGRKSSMTSGERGAVLSQASSDYETATETQSKHSSGGYSYHSAFARYAGDPNANANAENPFADTNGMDPGSPPPSSRLLTSAAGWRPVTAGSTASLSVMSSTGNSARELGSTPDPKDLFYHPPSTGQSVRPDTATSQPSRPWTAQSADPMRVSEESRTEETVREKNIAYPSLHGVVQQMQARR